MNIQIDRKEALHTVTDVKSRAVGSTYRRLTCATCGTILGKSFVTTSARLDRIRNAITLRCDRVTSYKLGTGSSLEGEPSNEKQTLSVALVGLDAQKALHLKEQMMMVQRCILRLSERVALAERTLRDASKETKANANKRLRASS